MVPSAAFQAVCKEFDSLYPLQNTIDSSCSFDAIHANQGIQKMDPITAVAIAGTAFKAIKRGIQIGNDIESMAGDINRWMGAIGNIREAEQKAKNPPFLRSLVSRQSVEQEAIEAFTAMKKAKAMEDELRTFINFEYGPNAWNEILQIQASIRKNRQEEKKKREELQETIWIWVLCTLVGLLIVGIIVFLFMYV